LEFRRVLFRSISSLALGLCMGLPGKRRRRELNVAPARGNARARTIQGADGTPIGRAIQAARQLSADAFTPQIDEGYKPLQGTPLKREDCVHESERSRLQRETRLHPHAPGN